MKIYKTSVNCRSCLSKKFNKILCIQKSAIDGIYNKNYEAPLTLMFCVRCGMVQLREIINKALYKDYNFTAENISVVNKWCQKLSGIIESENKKKSILEIGSGDGYFAKLISKENKVVCIEPSEKLVKEARRKFKLKIICGYFDKGIVFNKKFDIIVARHVLEHIENIKDFINKIVQNIKNDGTIVIEVPDFRKILATNNYANIFHEHLNYFSPNALSKLFEPYGFYPTRFLINDVHGGAVCIFFKKNKKIIKIKDPVNIKTLAKFSKGFSNYIIKMETASKIIKKYKKVYGYGAANKTFKLLSLMKIKPRQMNYIFDKNKNLHGQTIPQFGIKIISPDELDNVLPELIVIFATSYEKEIIKDLRLNFNYKNKFLSISGNSRII